MSQGFLTYFGMWADTWRSHFKTSLLLNDATIVMTPAGRSDWLPDAVDKCFPGEITNDQYQKLPSLLPALKEALPAYSFLSPPTAEDQPVYMQAFDNEALRLIGENPSDDPLHPGLLRGARLTAWGVVLGLRTWAALNSESRTMLFADEIERRVLARLSQDDHETVKFNTVFDGKIPLIRELPLGVVMDARGHPGLAGFRAKLAEVHLQLDAGHTRSVEELMEEMFRGDLEELANDVRPNVPFVGVKALATAVPLPIPLHPASVFYAAKDVLDERRRRERFGWLYFVLDHR